jgi:hypothetical protein
MVRKLVILALALAACAPPICEQGSMLDSELGLELTEEEHPEGWEHPECFGCHSAASLHKEGCTPGVDYEALWGLVDLEGDACCADCHGDNGVGS